MPCSHLVEHGPESKQVAAPVHRLPQGLLRAHVLNCPGHNSGTGLEFAGIIAGRCLRPAHGDFGQPKVENLDPTLMGNENIPRLDVAVDDALGVRGIKCIGNLRRQVEEPVGWQGESSGFQRRTCIPALHQ